MLEIQILQEGVPLVPGKGGVYRTVVGNHILSICNICRDPLTVRGYVYANRRRPFPMRIVQPGQEIVHTFCPEYCTTVHLEWVQDEQKVIRELYLEALYENAFTE